jgi:hypothetical protein
MLRFPSTLKILFINFLFQFKNLLQDKWEIRKIFPCFEAFTAVKRIFNLFWHSIKYYYGDKIKESEMGRHVARMGENFLIGKTEGKKPLGTPESRW